MKLFIASTSEDLGAHRQAVAEALERVQIRTVRMEVFGARPATPVAEALRLVVTADALVVILAHRFGWVPTAEEGGDGVRSITWLEVQTAQENSIPVFAFLVDERYTWSGPREQDRLLGLVRSNSGESPERVAESVRQLQAFREYLSSHFAIDVFSTPDSLASRVVTAVAHWASTLSKEAPRGQRNGDKRFRIVRLFLSSPGDVRDERDSAEMAVHRFNQEWFEEKGTFIKIVRWEKLAPQIGPGPQGVVNRQVGSESVDLFVGIMWNRFGTKTANAGSGTEEEFESALRTWRENARPWITFYFCTRPVTFSTKEQLDQKSRVLEFQERVGEQGIIRDYEAVSEFQQLLYQDLISITAQPEFQKEL